RKRKRRVGRALPHPDRKSLKTVSESHGGRGVSAVLISYVQGGFPHYYNPSTLEGQAGSRRVSASEWPWDSWDSKGEDGHDLAQPLNIHTISLVLVVHIVFNVSTYQNIKISWVPDQTHFWLGHSLSLHGCLVLLRADHLQMRKLRPRHLSRISTLQSTLTCSAFPAHLGLEISAKRRERDKSIFKESVQATESLLQSSNWEKKKSLCLLL
uniref:Transmembrane protein 120B n=1 Tax=Callithrix jacchus TaxID=9483 RepID=A0A8I3X286_CALJA